MSKICINCGKDLKDNDKFCGKCGKQVDIIDYTKKLKCKKCGYDLDANANFCLNCGEQIQASTTFTGERRILNEGHKEKIDQYAKIAKSKSKDFVEDVKNYKTLPKKKKRNIIIALGSVAAIIIIVFMLFNKGVSDEVVSEAALQIAEQDYGYKLEITSYDIVDSFNATSETFTGNTLKAKIYIAIIECQVRNTSGEIVETVKYGVIVADPKKSGDYVTYSSFFSQAENCTGMENEEIEDMLLSGTATYR